jgi:outer membrane protein TolC
MELDVWGQVRRAIEAQQAGAETNAANLSNALLAAQSALALAYVTLREADSLEDLLSRTIEDYKRSVTIPQNQYNAGTAAKSDVITAQAQLLNAQAALIAAGVSRTQSEHAIAVLMGRPPAGLSVSHGSLVTRVPTVPVGLPSSLLERRPDVAAAEQTMRQANAQIGVAFAGYFPAVSLSGLIGYSAHRLFGGNQGLTGHQSRRQSGQSRLRQGRVRMRRRNHRTCSKRGPADLGDP